MLTDEEMKMKKKLGEITFRKWHQLKKRQEEWQKRCNENTREGIYLAEESKQIMADWDSFWRRVKVL